jgi:hypothetical protein
MSLAAAPDPRALDVGLVIRSCNKSMIIKKKKTKEKKLIGKKKLIKKRKKSELTGLTL